MAEQKYPQVTSP